MAIREALVTDLNLDGHHDADHPVYCVLHKLMVGPRNNLGVVWKRLSSNFSLSVYLRNERRMPPLTNTCRVYLGVFQKEMASRGCGKQEDIGSAACAG